MPGFGKSGTCRMRVFSASILCSLSGPLRARSPNRKARRAPGRGDVLDVDRLDEGGGRTAPQRALHALDRFLVSLDHRFHPAVRQVAHVTVDAFDRRLRLREETEADTLHAPGDHQAPRHDHRRELSLIPRDFPNPRTPEPPNPRTPGW